MIIYFVSSFQRLFMYMGFFLCFAHFLESHQSRPNILVILADDLGYGDLSVSPFTGQGIKTPELEKMALSGRILTNFHDAAPICTPTRASILTGLFPWRLGIYSIYGTGKQAKEQLSVVPNIPLVFSEAGYHTAHIGKWHLGAMKPNDLVSRNQKAVSTENGNITCEDVSYGPLQHGFSEYVAMAEGPSSPRLTSLIPTSLLYHQGAKHLVRNDHEYFPTDEILTDRQASEAIRIMNETVQRGQNFFMQLWFDAPHGPWETIQPFDQWYASNLWEGPESRNFKYATMVSSLDHNVGRVRRALVDLGVENNTVVVFLSDNGPEGGAGSAGPFQGGKRSLREGGIRVPCIWQWPNRITANSTSAAFALSTDLFPTFMDAAGITRPEGLKLDGMSLLPILMDSEHSVQSDDRTVTWYKDIDGSSSAAWANGFKFLVDERGTQHLFDMRSDPTERTSLLNASSALLPTAPPAGRMRSAVRIGHHKISRITMQDTRLEDAQRLNVSHLLEVVEALKRRTDQFVMNGNKAHAAHKDLRKCHHKLSDVSGFDWNKSHPTAPEL